MNLLGSVGQLYMFVLLVLLFLGSGFALWRFLNFLMERGILKQGAGENLKQNGQIKTTQNNNVLNKVKGGLIMANNGWIKLAIFSFVGIIVSVAVLGLVSTGNTQGMNMGVQGSSIHQQHQQQNGMGNMNMQGGMNVNTPMGNMQMQGGTNVNTQMGNMQMQGNMNYGMTQNEMMMMQRMNMMQMQMNQMQQMMGMMNGNMGNMNNMSNMQQNNSGMSSGGGMGMMGGMMNMMPMMNMGGSMSNMPQNGGNSGGSMSNMPQNGGSSGSSGSMSSMPMM